MWTNKDFTDFWHGVPYCDTDIEIPNKPIGKPTVFNKSTLVWEDDTKTIAELLHSNIKSEFYSKLGSGAPCTTTSGKTFLMDAMPENYAFLLAGLRKFKRENKLTTLIRDFYNNWHEVTIIEFEELVNAVEDHGEQCLSWKWAEDKKIIDMYGY